MEDQQTYLATNVTNFEIFYTVKQLETWKAPCPDGLQTGFYEENWAIVSIDILQLIHWLL